MRVDNRTYPVLLRQFVNQLVNDDTRFGIQTGVRLVAEEVLGVHGYGTRNRHALLHTATYLAGHQCISPFGNVHTLKAETRPLLHLRMALVGEHLQRVQHILHDTHRVEQGSPLEEHPHLTAQRSYLFLFHVREVTAVVLNASRID